MTPRSNTVTYGEAPNTYRCCRGIKRLSLRVDPDVQVVICNGELDTFLADRRIGLTVITLRRTAPAANGPAR